jgi:hypothetical protein
MFSFFLLAATPSSYQRCLWPLRYPGPAFFTTPVIPNVFWLPKYAHLSFICWVPMCFCAIPNVFWSPKHVHPFRHLLVLAHYLQYSSNTRASHPCLSIYSLAFTTLSVLHPNLFSRGSYNNTRTFKSQFPTASSPLRLLYSPMNSRPTRNSERQGSLFPLNLLYPSTN